MQRLPIALALALLILTAVAGCAPASADQPFWNSTTVAQAEQSEPPALAVVDGAVVAAWVGADTRGVHHDARMIGADGPGQSVTLPLPPRQPRAQQMIPGSHGTAHLLWLDSDEDGAIRLYSALIGIPDLTVLRGPTTISDQPALRYAALPEPGGSVLVAWAGGHPAEPGVKIQRIDNEGRPTEQIGRIQAANFPSLLRIGNDIHVFWLSEQDGAAYRTVIASDHLQATQRLTSSPSQAAGDRLLDLRAGADRSDVTLFWNLMRADGACETWFASGTIDDLDLPVPTPLMLAVDTDSSVETGYNSGVVSSAHAGGRSACMAAPLSESGDTLPVGVQLGPDLAIIYFHDGQILGQQIVASGTELLRPPVLLSDGERNLYLGWSAPTATGVADLTLARSGAR